MALAMTPPPKVQEACPVLEAWGSPIGRLWRGSCGQVNVSENFHNFLERATD